MAVFEATRVKDAVWPEVFGIGTYFVAELIAASLDSRFKWLNGYPVVQTGVTAVALVGGMTAIGYNKAPGFAKGLVYGSGVGLIANLVSGLYQAATKQTVKIRLSDVAALVPRSVGSLPAGGVGGTALPPGVTRVPPTPQPGAGAQIGAGGSVRGTIPYGS